MRLVNKVKDIGTLRNLYRFHRGEAPEPSIIEPGVAVQRKVAIAIRMNLDNHILRGSNKLSDGGQLLFIYIKLGGLNILQRKA